MRLYYSISYLLDCIDGYAARALNQESRLGPSAAADTQLAFAAEAVNRSYLSYLRLLLRHGTLAEMAVMLSDFRSLELLRSHRGD